MENKNILQNSEITIIDVFRQQCSTLGRAAAVEKLQNSLGCILPNHSWRGYDDSNFINALVLKRVIRVRSILVQCLNLSFRSAPINDRVAIALLYKLCNDNNFDMFKLTGLILTNPPDVEYSCYLMLIISACLIKKTNVLNEIVSQVFDIVIDTPSVAQITSDETRRITSNALISNSIPRTERFNSKGIMLSPEAADAINQAMNIFNVGKMAQAKEKFENFANKLVVSTAFNPALQRQAEQMGLGQSLKSAKSRLLAKNRTDFIIAEAPNAELNVSLNREHFLMTYVLQMNSKVFLIRLLKLKFDNPGLNEFLVKSLKTLDILIITHTTQTIVNSLSNLAINYDQSTVLRQVINDEKLEILKEINICEKVPNVIPVKTLILKDIPEYVNAMPFIPNRTIAADGSITTIDQLEEDKRQKIAQIATALTNEFDIVERPDHWANLLQPNNPAQNVQPPQQGNPGQNPGMGEQGGQQPGIGGQEGQQPQRNNDADEFDFNLQNN